VCSRSASLSRWTARRYAGPFFSRKYFRIARSFNHNQSPSGRDVGLAESGLQLWEDVPERIALKGAAEYRALFPKKTFVESDSAECFIVSIKMGATLTAYASRATNNRIYGAVNGTGNILDQSA
jgi:hypothetical protein